jgi:hypothetical protein
VDSRARLGDLEKTSAGNRTRIIQILASLIRNELSRRPSGLSFLCATITQPQTNKINSSTNTLQTTSRHSVWHVRTMSYWIRHGNVQCPEEPLWRSADRQCEAETQLRGLRKLASNSRLKKNTYWGASWFVHIEYYQSYQIEGDEMGGACCMNWGERNGHWILVGKREGKWTLGRPRYRWDIKMGF